MKEDFNIEKLLNGFVDNELTERERIEVEHLIANDPAVAERIEELKKYKLLVNSLGISKAPDEILDNIKAAVAAEEYSVSKQSYGRRIAATAQLLFRKTVSVAAMFLLLFALAAVIYLIVSPTPNVPTETLKYVQDIKPTPMEDIQNKELTAIGSNGRKMFIPVGNTPPAANQLTMRLELKAPLAVGDEAVRKAFENAGITQFSESAIQTDKCQFSFNCTSQQLDSFLVSIEENWEQFKSTKLTVETDVVDQPAVINDVTTWQIAEIVSQDSFERRTKAAQYFAILNNMETLPGQIEDLNNMTIPKPVLTKDEFEPAAVVDSKPSINFSIILETAE